MSAKRIFRVPELKEYGSLEDLTRFHLGVPHPNPPHGDPPDFAKQGPGPDAIQPVGSES